MTGADNSSPTGVTRIFQGDIIFIGLATLLAVFLRLLDLGRPLTMDEVVSFNRYAFLPWQQILFFYDDTNQHSLFSLLSNICMRLFGESEIPFRLPVFLAGVFSVPLLYHVSRSLDNPRGTSFIASCLLAVSEIHLSYSQQGRGYALTVFLALLMAFSAVRLKKNPIAWGALLIASGVGLVLALPSNAYFLAAMGIYQLTGKWLGKTRASSFFDRSLIPLALTYTVLFLLAAAYYYINHAGILAGARINLPLVARGVSHFTQIAALMISPWSPWLYVIPVCGLLDLRSKNNELVLLLSSVFIVPGVLTFATGIGGFARTYIYLLPFGCMLAALGLEAIITLIRRRTNPYCAYGCMAILAAGLILQSARYVAYHHSRDYSGEAISMAEARQVSSYMQTAVPPTHLIVLLGHPEMNILNRYLRKQITESMLSFTLGKVPEKMILVGYDALPPETYRLEGFYEGFSLGIPRSAIKEIKTIGNTHIYEFGKSIARFIPHIPSDYEPTLVTPASPSILETENVKTDYFPDNQALVFRKKNKEPVTVDAGPEITVDIQTENSYILSIHTRKYGQASNVFFMSSDIIGWPPTVGYINHYLGEITISGAKFNWQMVFALAPVRKGVHDFHPVFHLTDEVSYFDQIQSFIISPDKQEGENRT